MSDEVMLRALTGASNIPYADEDGPTVVVPHCGRSRFASDDLISPKNAPSQGPCPRNASNIARRRYVAHQREFDAKEEERASLNEETMFGQKEHQQKHGRLPVGLKRKDDSTFATESALQRYENAVLRYQKPKIRPKRQMSRERQQQQQQQQSSSQGYSSSDESVIRNKSKSTSSIDTQSVNNILDEYEDLDYRQLSDLSDVGSITVTNFEAMMDQQKRQMQQHQPEKPRNDPAKVQTKCSPVREKLQPVLKVNQQTQVRQRSRDRQKEPVKQQVSPPAEENARRVSSPIIDDGGRSKASDVLLRKGEVQKRVDEWLSHAQSQNFAGTREKPLTRSNSSAEQKSQRRYRQDSRSRSIDEGRDKLNGTSSSYDDLSRAERKTPERKVDKVSVGVNTSRGTYKEYLAIKNRSKQDYGFSASGGASGVSRSRDISPGTNSRIPQRGPMGSSFRSRRHEDETRAENADGQGTAQVCSEKIGRESRLANLVKTRNESEHGSRVSGSSVGNSIVAAVTSASSSSTSSSASPTTTAMTAAMTTAITSAMTTSIMPGRRPSFRRSQTHEQSAPSGGVKATTLVKEETRTRGPGGNGTGGGGGGGTKGLASLGDRGESISPNKEGESRRPALTDSARPGDKAVDPVCKSTDASRPDRGPIGGDPQSRQPADVRRDGKMDQGKSESAYGTVGERVRALQDLRTPKQRSSQQSAPADSRKPPILPRKDQARQEGKTDGSPLSSPIASAQSSFKPNNRVYATLYELNEQNSAKSKVVAAESGNRSLYSSPNHVEKIYERSLQPQVIHADDLESILRPALQVSAYGERVASRSDRKSPVNDVLAFEEQNEEKIYERIGDLRYEQLETIEEDDQRSESSACRYPEIGLNQCLKVQQGLPNGRARGTAAEPKKEAPIYAKWEQQVILNEPARTFATFQSNCQQNSSLARTVSALSEAKDSTEQEDKKQLPREPIIVLEDFDADSYEAGMLSSLVGRHSRENSNLSTATLPLDELESERRFPVNEESVRPRSNECPDQPAESRRLQADLIQTVSEKSQGQLAEDDKSREKGEERGSVVNEVLVKNLQFKQDLPKDHKAERPSETSGSVVVVVERTVQQMPLNFHSVLSDDYENVHAQDARFKESKVYVTKEEMERQRLMDLLRKGDYETVKSVSEQLFLMTLFTRLCSAP